MEWYVRMFTYGLIIPLFSFILQIWPRLINRYFGIDTWRHLMFAEYVRKHGHLPESITDRYLVTAPFDYPPTIILFLSLFSKSFADKYQFIFSPIFDLISNLFIFSATFFLSGSLTAALFAQVVASLIPLVVMEASNLSTRVVSYLIFSLSFFSLVVFSINREFIWLLLAYITLFILFLTHKFAIQAYLFNSLGFSIIKLDLTFILFFICTFLSTLIFTNKLYKPVLKGHIAILNFWAKNIKLRFAHQFRGLPKNNQSIDFIQKLYLLSVNNPLMAILGGNPWLAVFIVLTLLNSLRLYPFVLSIDSRYFNDFSLWIFLSTISALLILSIPKLRFLGEGQRYIEYAVLPVSIVLGCFFTYLFSIFKFYFLVILILLSISLLIGIVYLQYKTILKDRSRTVSTQLWRIINYLNKRTGSKVRLAIFPINLGDAMMYFLKGKVLTSDSIVGMLKIKDVYPIVTGSTRRIIKKYDLNYIIIDQRYVYLKELKLNKYKIILNENDYMLIRV